MTSQGWTAHQRPVAAVPAIAAFAAERYGDRVLPPLPADLTRWELGSLGGRRAPERLAAILAAKRAVRRLFGDLEPRDIEILRRENSAPLLRIRGSASGLSLSLSHGGGLAVAAVLAHGEAPCAR
ncbi:Phosphopantetheinyl transferase (holo-ACP synthase) [Streptomyces sp. DvalAA-14]|uniref:hypothetical protein n=1 Tax=unclassified Streptomyces TaxID=2593676 RepID=UPI00081AF908|nr:MULTISPECIES: hypothetical protein [unclassified Streptomyces]MYS21714.1 hypothetical protein [Streptomyces sp. SID4948]SCD99476.1 Phosphopantetheinyl transferase (holo-ACP synthase) [Streptomyces sp. DvalAA-14]